MAALKVFLLLLAVGSVAKADVAQPLMRRFFAANGVANKVENRAFCPENYAPCSCVLTTNGLEISCVDVSIEDVKAVFFNTKEYNIYSVVMSTTSTTGSVALPADLFSDKRVQNIYLMCPAKTYGLSIDPSAFQYTRGFTTHFEIDGCDLTGLLDFSFLENFSVLKELVVLNSVSVNLKGLPGLNSLSELTLTDSTGVEENAADFPSLTPARISKLSVNRCGLTDTGVNSILLKVGSSTSAGSLTYLDLSGNLLTVVPSGIHSLAKLTDLMLMSNRITETKVGDLGFVSQVNAVYMDNNELAFMAGDTFEYGDFTKAGVHLTSNLLPTFEKNVFFNILSQMSVQPVEVAGFVDVQDNPFSCKCELAWLIRDHPQLLPYVRNAKCDGFFKFEELNPAAYVDCPPSV